MLLSKWSRAFQKKDGSHEEHRASHLVQKTVHFPESLGFAAAPCADTSLLLSKDNQLAAALFPLPLGLTTDISIRGRDNGQQSTNRDISPYLLLWVKRTSQVREETREKLRAVNARDERRLIARDQMLVPEGGESWPTSVQRTKSLQTCSRVQTGKISHPNVIGLSTSPIAGTIESFG